MQYDDLTVYKAFRSLSDEKQKIEWHDDFFLSRVMSSTSLTTLPRGAGRRRLQIEVCNLQNKKFTTTLFFPIYQNVERFVITPHQPVQSIPLSKRMHLLYFTVTYFRSVVSLRHFQLSCVTVSQHDVELTTMLKADG